MLSKTKPSSRPGAVGGNVPGDSLALRLRGRGGITGTGLRGGLPASPLGRGSQPRAARTTHITTGLLLLTGRYTNLRKEDRENPRMTNRTWTRMSNTVTAFRNIRIKKNSPHQSFSKARILKHKQAWSNCLSKYKKLNRDKWKSNRVNYVDGTRHLVFSESQQSINQAYVLDAHTLHSLTSLLIWECISLVS